jgi:general secretion pathway protein G
VCRVRKTELKLATKREEVNLEMMSRMVSRKHKGFTLIEMLIVIVVIAILALIVIPRLLGAGRKAKEATLRGDMHQIRNAIQQFEADCGDYPLTIDQLQTVPGDGTDGGTGVALDVTAWQGPYLRTPDNDLPVDPFRLPTDTPRWDYTAGTGHVQSLSTLTALNGDNYSDW